MRAAGHLKGRVGAGGGPGSVGMEASEAAVEKGSPRFITAHPGHHTNANQPWSFSVILGLSFPSGKVHLSRHQVVGMVQLRLALGS